MAATRWINIFAFLWFTQFLFGCQDFVIAGNINYNDGLDIKKDIKYYLQDLKTNKMVFFI